MMVKCIILKQTKDDIKKMIEQPKSDESIDRKLKNLVNIPSKKKRKKKKKKKKKTRIKTPSRKKALYGKKKENSFKKKIKKIENSI